MKAHKEKAKYTAITSHVVRLYDKLSRDEFLRALDIYIEENYNKPLGDALLKQINLLKQAEKIKAKVDKLFETIN